MSSQINLRALEPEDLEVLYKWENNKDIWKISNTITPFSKFVLKQYLENAANDIFENKQLRLIIENKNTKELLGAIDLFDFDPYHLRAGIGVLIADKEQRSKGIGSEALTQLIEYAFSTLLLKQLYCNILSSNENSIKMFSKFGFKIIGVKKNWIRTKDGWEDEVMMQLINTNFKI